MAFQINNKKATSSTNSITVREDLLLKAQRIIQLERYCVDIQIEADLRVLHAEKEYKAQLVVVQDALESIVQINLSTPDLAIKAVQAAIKAKNALCVIHEEKIRKVLAAKQAHRIAKKTIEPTPPVEAPKAEVKLFNFKDHLVECWKVTRRS